MKKSLSLASVLADLKIDDLPKFKFEFKTEAEKKDELNKMSSIYTVLSIKHKVITSQKAKILQYIDFLKSPYMGSKDNIDMSSLTDVYTDLNLDALPRFKFEFQTNAEKRDELSKMIPILTLLSIKYKVICNQKDRTAEYIDALRSPYIWCEDTGYPIQVGHEGDRYSIITNNIGSLYKSDDLTEASVQTAFYYSSVDKSEYSEFNRTESDLTAVAELKPSTETKPDFDVCINSSESVASSSSDSSSTDSSSTDSSSFEHSDSACPNNSIESDISYRSLTNSPKFNNVIRFNQLFSDTAIATAAITSDGMEKSPPMPHTSNASKLTGTIKALVNKMIYPFEKKNKHSPTPSVKTISKSSGPINSNYKVSSKQSSF